MSWPLFLRGGSGRYSPGCSSSASPWAMPGGATSLTNLIESEDCGGGTLQDSGILTDAGALVGFFVLVGYGAKLAIEWCRGNKSVATEWRAKALQDAAASHDILMGMFNPLREQVDSLEEDLRESKAREAEVLAAHRNEVAQYKV